MKLVRDASCTDCKLHSTAEFVCLLGQGPVPCNVAIIGEAPGKREDDSGKPFVGKAGQYLDEVLTDVGLPRKNVFITNAVSCRPPENRTPSKREIQACNKWLTYQLQKVKPKFILLLGNTALEAITGEKGIKAARGKPFEKEGILYLPTYHPSYILRGDFKDDPIFRNDLKLFKSLIEGGGLPEEKRLSIKIVKDDKSFEKMLQDLRGAASFDIETSGLYPWARKRPGIPEGGKTPDPRSYDAQIKSLGFGTKRHQWIWLTDEYEVTPERLRRVKERLDECVVVGHYAKFDLLWMQVIYNAYWQIDFDTGVAHYLLDENTPHGLKELAQRFCGAPNWDVDAGTKQGKGSREKLIKYHAHDLFYTLELYYLFREQLAEDPAVRRVFKKILMPCTRIFTDAEYEGSYIDLSRMNEVEKQLRANIKTAERNLEKWVPVSKKGKDKKGEPLFNWGSPQQVGWLLFKKLKLKCPEVTKTGAPSTSETSLKQIDHPLIKDLFDLRGANQQLSFFIEGWKPYLVGPRIHPSFKLTGTVTGRLSCEHPNWQQVPRDKLIRTLLIAPPGWELIEADLSQIELRIAAELSGDKALIDAFVSGKDPHWITALQELRRGGGEHDRILKTANRMSNQKITDYDEAIELMLERGADAAIEIDYAWKELRKKAKAVNFGFLYGMWWKKFKIYARDKYDVHLTDEQAQESRTSFFSTWRDLEDWHKRAKRFARRNGYMRYLSGRKRRLPGAMLDGESFEKGEAERQAVNSPVQGFANEINLMALIQLQKEFPKTIYRPIATVHDSILAYARREHAERISLRTMEVMRKPELFEDFEIEMRVPIEADVKLGPWGAGVSLKDWLKANGKKKRI